MKKRDFTSGFLHGTTIRSTVSRIKTIGIVFGIFVALLAILGPIMSLFFNFSYYTLSSENLIKRYVEAGDLIGLMPKLCMLGAFIMTLLAFNYLNHRGSSDFFHAIAEKRTTTFLSNIAAVIITICIIAAAGGVLCCIMGLILSFALNLNYFSVFMVVMNSIAGALLVSAATSLSMSITGTLFSNIVLSAIVLFMPNTLIRMFNSAVIFSLPSANISAGNAMHEVLGGLNIVSSGSQTLHDGWALLYTAVLAAVYIAIGAALYNRRRSEIAGRSAPSRRLQLIYRILVGFAAFSVVTAIAFVIIYGIVLKDNSADYTFLYVIIFVGYIVAAIVYFLYELISTKKWKNVASAIPGLGIVILLSIAMFAAMSASYGNEAYFAPKADEIEYVCFSKDEGGIGSIEDYYMANIDEYKIEDEQVKQIVSDSLLEYTQALKTQSKLSDEYTEFYTMGIKTANRYELRYVNVRKKEGEILQSYYDDAVRLVEKSVSSIELDPNNCRLIDNTSELSNKQQTEVLNSALKELKGLTLSQWSNRQKRAEYEGAEVFIRFETGKDYGQSILSNLFGSMNYFTVPINKYTLPNTHALVEGMLAN